MSRFHFSAWLGLCMWKQAHLFIYLLPYIRRSSVHIFPKLLAHHSFTHSSSSDQQSQSSDQVNSPFICLRHLPGLFSDAHFLGYSCLLTNQIVCGQTLLVIIVIVSHSVMSHSLQPMDCSLPGFSVHGISQARILKWVAMSSSRDFSDPGIKPASVGS